VSTLENIQSFIRNNGEEIIGIEVPVVLSDEDQRYSPIQFKFGWAIEIGVSSHDHHAHCPSGDGVRRCGSRSSASAEAHSDAKSYISGADPLFNQRFHALLGNDIADNFQIGNQDIGSAPCRYVGSDPCYACGGRGTNSCGSCHGSGKNSCYGCNGSGRVNTQRYDSYNNRTVYSTESCSSCYGSGQKSCSNCGGSGSVRCGTCEGGGYLYYSYTIDGAAKRHTTWGFDDNSHHQWAGDFVGDKGYSIANLLNEIKEIDAPANFKGCTFIYAMSAILPTLQYQAKIDHGSTHLCLAGNKNHVHDAGAIYDPALWSVAQHLGSGDQATDKKVLGVPAVKSILEASETNSKIDLLKQHWVSQDIADAVITNYQELVAQLKKSSVKGIIPRMLASGLHNAFIFVCIVAGVAMLLPIYAEEVVYRFSPMYFLNLNVAFFSGYFSLFELPIFTNYIIAPAYYWLIYKLVKKCYWKRIGGLKLAMISLLAALGIIYIGLTVNFVRVDIMNAPMEIGAFFAGFSCFASIYLFFWLGAKPKKWYLKPLAALGGAAIIIAGQLGLAKLNDLFEFIVVRQGNYANEVWYIITNAFMYVGQNSIDLVIVTILFTYFSTRRRFWLNSKVAVAQYDSPVLIKSMKMD